MVIIITLSVKVKIDRKNSGWYSVIKLSYERKNYRSLTSIIFTLFKSPKLYCRDLPNIIIQEKQQIMHVISDTVSPPTRWDYTF